LPPTGAPSRHATRLPGSLDPESYAAGGEVAAELTSVFGLLDLAERRLVPDPRAVWHRHARHPELLGLS
jgi:hypothetical protein